jgi:dipeptidase E
MRVLLGSGGFRTPVRVVLLREAMQRHFGEIRKLLFVPYALADHDGYVASTVQRGLDAGYHIDGIHTHTDPTRAVWEAEGIFIGGGNTFRLLKSLYDLELLDVIRAKVKAGLPYLGVSAGCNVACPTIRTTNDMPIVEPPSLQALGLVPFQVNPHYVHGPMSYQDAGGQYHVHFGETRDDRLREFHEENNIPVVGLWEAGLLHYDGQRLLLSATPARVFRPGEVPVDVEPGADLSALVLGMGGR